MQHKIHPVGKCAVVDFVLLFTNTYGRTLNTSFCCEESLRIEKYVALPKMGCPLVNDILGERVGYGKRKPILITRALWE